MNADEFWGNVDVRGDNECWPWLGVVFCNGYGRSRWGRAHRVAFFLKHGRWPNICRHECDHRLCCNPAHLLDGTNADNSADMVRRDRHGNAKLSVQEVNEIRSSKDVTSKTLAKKYGVEISRIQKIRRGVTWRSV